MHDEVELSLSLDSGQLKRLRRNPLVRALAQRRAKTEKLVSVYFDTPDNDLQSQGMALRIRRVGARRIQTLKAPAPAGTKSLQSHREFEAEVQQDTPDLGLVEDEALRARFAECGLAGKLAPVFTTSISRYSVPLRFADSELELALDSGEIHAGERSLKVSEAELELVSGKATRIYELALAIGEQVPFVLERRNKARRGYELRGSGELTAAKAVPVALSEDMTAAQAFVRIAHACLDQICANESVVLGSRDPEGVHQMRVGVRRFRALISAFREIMDPGVHAFLREELRWLQQALGPAREWDVFAEETLAQISNRLPDAQGLALMGALAEELREEGYATARGALRDRRYTAFLLRTELLLEEGGWSAGTGLSRNGTPSISVRDMARRVLDRNDRKLRKLSKKHRELREDELHRIRILGKKMRYCVEFFASLFPQRRVERHQAILKAIQDTLGTLNDAVVGRQQIEELRQHLPAGKADAKRELALAGATLRGWQAANIERDLQRFTEIWPTYRKAKRYWNGKS